MEMSSKRENEQNIRQYVSGVCEQRWRSIDDRVDEDTWNVMVALLQVEAT